MQEIPGKRPNTSRFVYDGYEYHVCTTAVHIYRCSTRSTTGCQGRVSVGADGRVEVIQPHQGHGRDDTIVLVSEMRVEMLNRAAQTHAPLKEIFDDVCRRNPELAPQFLFPRMRNAMQRARARVRPVIPNNLRELAEALRTYEATMQVYRGLVEAEDGSVALIFASAQMLEAVSACTEIYVDGTFKVAPYHPPISQLYTIHMRVMNSGIAAVYVLCGARTRALYNAIFTRLTELAPGISENLRFIMGDYERAAMSALRDVFPVANRHGCWFHFNQALVRRWKRLGLADVRTSILSMAMALPLAPADQFDEGLAILAQRADVIAVDHPAVLQFMAYLRRQWSPLADVVSVHGCPSRTNNLVESFHNEAKRKLGGLHPNIWKFIEHLTDLISTQDVDLIRLQNGERARRPRTLRNMNADAIIRDAQHDLGVGRYTLAEFLTRCSTRTAGLVGGLNVDQPHIEDQEDEADNELVQLGVMAAGEGGGDERVLRGGRQGRGGRRGRGARPRLPVHPNRGAEERDLEAPQLEDRRPLALPVPELRPERRLGEHPANDVLDVVDLEPDRDIYHLPEDDFEQLPMPEEEEVPYHPVEPLPEVEDGAGMRLPDTCCACLVSPATHAFAP